MFKNDADCAFMYWGKKGEKIKEERGAGSVSPSLPPKAYEVS